MDNIAEKLHILLKRCNIELPDYLIRLLYYTGYDNVISLMEINNESIENMEDFAKTKLNKLLKGPERDTFFGIFTEDVNLFEVVPGHKQLLFSLRDKLIALSTEEQENARRSNIESKINKNQFKSM